MVTRPIPTVESAAHTRDLGLQISSTGHFVKENEMSDETAQFDAIIINEVQLLLAEKRTSLAVMRTGIAVLALPLSVVGLLIATSKYYDILNVMHFLVPFGLLNVGLVLLGSYLIIRSVMSMLKVDRHIHQIKLKYSSISNLIEQ